MEKIKCRYCSGKNIIKKGKRKTKFLLKQVYYCKDCCKKFILSNIKNKTFPTRVIMGAISYYNLGYSLEKTSKLINSKYKVKTNGKSIFNWVGEFKKICSYHRLRKKIIEEYDPEFIICKKLFWHVQPYLFRYHEAKVGYFINDYFSSLRDYLKDVVKKCPGKLFLESNVRCSGLRLPTKININHTYNYACKLARLALEIASDNKERHETIQNFMLANDTTTIAVEVPVYLFPEEAKKFDIFKDVKIEKAITGHIDILQMKFGNIHILDYKPEAAKEKRETVVSQLLVYAIALSKRTGIFLRNFRCAWFDEKNYYEFNPSSLILATQGEISRYELKEYLPRDKENSYFTSKRFQEKRKSKDKIIK